MTPQENMALVRRYIDETWNKGNLQVIDEVVAEDYIQHVNRIEQRREGVTQFFLMLRKAFPDIHNTIQIMLAENDRVVWQSNITGTHMDTFQGVPATGKSIKITATNFLRVVNGKFVENWGEQDNLGLLQQLGVIPKPGA